MINIPIAIQNSAKPHTFFIFFLPGEAVILLYVYWSQYMTLEIISPFLCLRFLNPEYPLHLSLTSVLPFLM